LEGIAWRSAAEQALWSVDLENICEVHGISIDGPVPGAAFVVESLLDRLA
jgi:beta-galactosidase